MRAVRLGVVLAAALAWGVSAPRYVLGGDDGELAAIFGAGGVAHPPGYPTMVLWLRLFHLLPAVTPAHGAALATVVVAALAVVALQWACTAWGASAGAATVASTLFAFAPLTWSLASHAEVFAMNALFAGVILALAGPGAPIAGARRVVALAAVAGIALGDHLSIALLAPVGIYGALRGAREAKQPALAVAAAVGVFAACLVAPYAYELFVARTSDPLASPVWLEEASVRGVWFHFRRGAYGSLALAGGGAAREPLRQMIALGRGAVVDLLGLPILVVVAVARALARGRRDALVRPESLAFAASLLMAGPLFVAAFDVPLDGVGRGIVERFYLLPELLLCIPGALAIDAFVRAPLERPLVAVAASAALAATQAFAWLDARRESTRPTVALYVDNTLRSAPPNAIVVGSGDSRWSGFLYARYALGLRTDVAFITPRLLPQAWYRRVAERLTGVDFETPSGGPIGPRTTIARLLATGRPVFFTDWTDPKIAETPHYAVGTLMRVLAPGEAPPPTDALEAMNDAAFSGFTLEATPPRDPNGWGYALAADYARPWGELAQRYDTEGRHDDAQRCLARAAVLAPWVVTVRRRPDDASP